MRTPVIRISELAKKAFQDAAADGGEDASGDFLKLTISSRFEADLFFGQVSGGIVGKPLPADCAKQTEAVEAAQTRNKAECFILNKALEDGAKLGNTEPLRKGRTHSSHADGCPPRSNDSRAAASAAVASRRITSSRG